MTKPKKTSWEEEKLGHLEKMLTNLSHLTGQHHKDEFWVNIVKAGVLDLWLWFADIMEKREIQVRQEAIRETIEAVEKELQDMEVDLVETTSQEYDNGWNECNLKWDLRIIDLEKCLAELKKKERIE